MLFLINSIPHHLLPFSFHSIYCLPLFLCMPFLHCNLHLLPMLLPFSSAWLATWLVPHTLPVLLLGLSLILYLSCYLVCPSYSTWFAPTLACPYTGLPLTLYLACFSYSPCLALTQPLSYSICLKYKTYS